MPNGELISWMIESAARLLQSAEILDRPALKGRGFWLRRK